MPVQRTTRTFDDLRNEAEKMFNGKRSPATALVYHGGNAEDFIGIRIECTKAGKEFVSNINFGRDPEGDLYYDDTTQLTGLGKYEVLFNVGQVLQITIRNPNGKIVAIFVGQDPASAIGWLSFDADHPQNAALVGNWLDYHGVDATSTIKCAPGSTEVTLKLESLGRKVTFQLPKPSANGINHEGTTTVTSVKAIRNGTYSMVDFDADRILFYPKVGGKDLAAYFIPNVKGKADLVALGQETYIVAPALMLYGKKLMINKYVYASDPIYM